MPADIADVGPVDVAIVVEVGDGGGGGEAEIHVLLVIERPVVVIFPELLAGRQVDHEEGVPRIVILTGVIAATEEGDEFLRPVVHLDLADGWLRPGLRDLRVGEAPEVGGVRRVGNIQRVIVLPAPSLAKDDDRLPDASDFDIGGDWARIHVEGVRRRSLGQILQAAEEVWRDKGPQFLAVTLAEGVEHPVVGAGDQDRRPAGVGLLEGIVGWIYQVADRRGDQDRARMIDVPELPGPLLGDVQIQVLVKGVDPPDEVDDLVPFGGVSRGEEGGGDRGVALGEVLLDPTHRGEDRPGVGQFLAEQLSGLPDQGRVEGDAVHIHRHLALRIALIGLQEALPERMGEVG